MLGDFLVEQKLISSAQLSEVLSELPRSGRKIGQLLIEKGYVEEKKLKEALEVLLNQKNVDIYEGDTTLLDKNGVVITRTRILNRGKTYPVKPTSSARRTQKNYKRIHQSPDSSKGGIMIACGLLTAIAGMLLGPSAQDGQASLPIIAWIGLSLCLLGIITYRKKVVTTYTRHYLELFEHGLTGVRVFKDSQPEFIDEAVAVINKNIASFENWEDRKEQYKVSTKDLERARVEMNKLRESRGQKPIDHQD
ncbi:hypothetical protein CL659_04800 [bacterium]|nr:hypothetical protein [bacterium]|tara:strand:- start:6803 stop:7552 length:750 start_codon:yes stop_codon:yes gene_type:complete